MHALCGNIADGDIAIKIIGGACAPKWRSELIDDARWIPINRERGMTTCMCQKEADPISIEVCPESHCYDIDGYLPRKEGGSDSVMILHVLTLW